MKLTMEQTQQLIDRLASALNHRDWTAYSDVFAEGLIVHAPGLKTVGREKRVEWVIGLITAFPDGQITLRRTVAQDDWVCAELTFDGTHTGPLLAGSRAIAATKRHVAFPYCLVMRLEGGRIAELHEYFDQVELLTQLGLMAQS